MITDNPAVAHIDFGSHRWPILKETLGEGKGGDKVGADEMDTTVG